MRYALAYPSPFFVILNGLKKIGILCTPLFIVFPIKGTADEMLIFFAEVGDLASARAIFLHHPEHFINFSWLISSSMMSTSCRQKVTILESEVIGTVIYLELGVTH